MIQFLIRHFIKNYQNTSDLKVRASYGKFAGLVGILTNLLLSALKFIAGTLFHSIAVVADAVNNLSDSASSIVTLVGFKLAEKPADAEHPFGHERIEYISGMIVSFVILALGFQLGQESVLKIISPEPAEISFLTVAVLVISILIKLWQCLFYRSMGTAIASEALLANSIDSRNDVISTSAILLGMALTALTGFNLDGYMGLVVAIMVFLTGIHLIRDTSNPLLGVAPSKEMVDEIYHRIMAYPGVLGMHDLTVHNYGAGNIFASVHCEVDARADIMKSHDMIDNIEKDFHSEMGIQLVIHMDPIVTNDERTNRLKERVKDALHLLSPEITMHDFRVVWGTTHSNVLFDICVPFGFSTKDDILHDQVVKMVEGLDPKYRAVITVDHNYIPSDAPEE